MVAVDRNPQVNTFEGPIVGGFEITKHDTNELAYVTRGIYVGVTGNLKVTLVDGSVVTFIGLAAGVIHPIRAKIVWSAVTTATSIVGLY